MKKWLGFILLIVLLAIGVLLVFNLNKNKIKSIDSFSSIELEIIGMRGTEVYEIINNGESSELSHYRVVYKDGNDGRMLQGRETIKTEEVLEILNEFKIYKWDGFSGKHPKNVSDGKMFNFSALVNDGLKISATGSENFPKNYHEFVNWLNDILIRSNGIMKK